MWLHFIWYRPAQHPALTNDIGSFIDQKFRIVFQRAVVHGIRVEGLGISQGRFIKCTLGSVQKAYPQIFRGSFDDKMGTIFPLIRLGGVFRLPLQKMAST